MIAKKLEDLILQHKELTEKLTTEYNYHLATLPPYMRQELEKVTSVTPKTEALYARAGLPTPRMQELQAEGAPILTEIMALFRAYERNKERPSI